MITQDHNIVIAVNATTVLTAIEQRMDGFAIANPTFFKHALVEMALVEFGIAYCKTNRPRQLCEQSKALAKLIIQEVATYFWYLFTNILTQWVVIDEIKIIGNWEIWLCLNKR